MKRDISVSFSKGVRYKERQVTVCPCEEKTDPLWMLNDMDVVVGLLFFSILIVRKNHLAMLIVERFGRFIERSKM